MLLSPAMKLNDTENKYNHLVWFAGQGWRGVPILEDSPDQSPAKPVTPIVSPAEATVRVLRTTPERALRQGAKVQPSARRQLALSWPTQKPLPADHPPLINYGDNYSPKSPSFEEMSPAMSIPDMDAVTTSLSQRDTTGETLVQDEAEPRVSSGKYSLRCKGGGGGQDTCRISGKNHRR